MIPGNTAAGRTLEQHLFHAFERLGKWDPDGALGELEEALDLEFQEGGSEGLPFGAAELFWWAGVCCYRVGRGYQARGYWQAAAARRAASPAATAFRGLAVRQLGGLPESHFLAAEVLQRAEALDEAAPPDWALARALTLLITGERQEAAAHLDYLAETSPEYPRGRIYQQLLADGFLDLL